MNQYHPLASTASPRRPTFGRRMNIILLGVVVALAGVLTSACRDTEPARTLNWDLGDEGTPLPPPAVSARMNPALRDGRAEWRDFREPQLARMTGAPGVEQRGADESRPAAPATQDDVQIRRIRATLDEYNALVAEGKTDELIDYHVEAQIEKMELLSKRTTDMIQKLSDLRQAFESRLPDQADRIARVFDSFDELFRMPMTVEGITIESEGRATGIFANLPVPVPVQFELEEDVWYIRMPEMLLDQSLSMIEGGLPMFDQLKSSIESGDAPAEPMLAALEQSMQMMKNAMGGAPAEGG